MPPIKGPPINKEEPRGFFDGRCPRCNTRVGWMGTFRDRPPCRKCGHVVPAEELEEDEKAIKKMEDLLIERMEEQESKKQKVAAETPKEEKVKHVKSQGQTRQHHCHGGMPGCKGQCPPAKWGCYPCWMKLPKRLREAIWAAYVPGQERNLSPSLEYLSVAREVQRWIKENYGVEDAP